MDFAVIEYANKHDIHPVSFSSLSESSTDLPGLKPAVAKIAAARNLTSEQVMYCYVSAHNITVLSSFDPQHLDWAKQDIAIFDPASSLSPGEIASLDALTGSAASGLEGPRTCTDCYTFECQACALKLNSLGCDIGPLHGGFVWGRSNPHGVECTKCAVSAKNKAEVVKACGSTAGGESLRSMVPKACGC